MKRNTLLNRMNPIRFLSDRTDVFAGITFREACSSLELSSLLFVSIGRYECAFGCLGLWEVASSCINIARSLRLCGFSDSHLGFLFEITLS